MDIYKITIADSLCHIGGQIRFFLTKKCAEEFFYKALAKNNLFDYLDEDGDGTMSAKYMNFFIRFETIHADDGFEKKTKYDMHSLVYGPLEEYERQRRIA